MVAILLISGVHGFVVAYMATLFGDRQPAHDGRRTLNPFVHLDLLGAAGLLLFGLGWARPIAIDRSELRSPRKALFTIVVCGLVAVLALGLLAYRLRPLAVASMPTSAGLALASALNATANLSIWFALLNLLPIPPLTGRYLAYPFLRTEIVGSLERHASRASIALAVLIVTGMLPWLVTPVFRTISNRLLNLL